MRKLVSGLFMSLDGVVEAPDQWQFEFFDDDLAAAMATQIAEEDTIVLGRRTYEEWAEYWPNQMDDPYAEHINPTPKYVVSTTLERAPWGAWDNTTLIKSNVAQAITDLKQQPGKNIGIGGSITLVRSLLREGLIDELTLIIHPVAVGRGKRLFHEGDPLTKFELAYSQPTRSGVLILTYLPR